MENKTEQEIVLELLKDIHKNRHLEFIENGKSEKFYKLDNQLTVIEYLCDLARMGYTLRLFSIYKETKNGVYND